MYFLFSDDEVFNREIAAESWRGAILAARDWFSIRGRLRIVAEYGSARDYALIGSDYRFTLRRVEQ